LTNNSDFKQKVTKFYRILEKNSDSQVDSSNLFPLFKSIYRLLLPTFTVQQLEHIANEEIEKQGKYFSLDDIYDYFAHLCFLFLFKYTVQTAINFVENLYLRIVKRFYLNLQNQKTYEVDYAVHISMKQQFGEIIYMETLVEDKFVLEQAINN
jgi:uncharacterized membrane protein (GlpM family)